jgi:hypothetical protein
MLCAIVISAYLSAALLPCKPPDWLRSTVAATHAAAEPGSGTDDHSHHVSETDSGPSAHAAHAHGHHGRIEAASAGPSNGASGDAVPITKTELRAKCPCGCDETGSEVGGETRLGRVLPGLHVPRLIARAADRAAEPTDPFFDEYHGELDPVPI